jgi:hypothetical protein
MGLDAIRIGHETVEYELELGVLSVVKKSKLVHVGYVVE